MYSRVLSSSPVYSCTPLKEENIESTKSTYENTKSTKSTKSTYVDVHYDYLNNL